MQQVTKLHGTGKKIKKKRGDMKITTGFPHLHRPHHLQAPHDH